VPDRPVPDRFRGALRELVHRLVIRDYEGLVRDQLAHDGFELWIGDYPGELVDLPDAVWDVAEAGETSAAGTWWVVVPLWTDDEGPSDLSMEGTIVEAGSELVVTINDVHVL